MYVDIHNFAVLSFLLLFCHIWWFLLKRKKALDDSDWYIFQDAASMDLVASTLVDFFSLWSRRPQAGTLPAGRGKRRHTGEGGQQGFNGVNGHLKSHEESETFFVRNDKNSKIKWKQTQMTRRNWAANVVFSGYKPPLLAQPKIEINLGFLRPYAQWLRWPALRSAQKGGRWGRKYLWVTDVPGFRWCIRRKYVLSDWCACMIEVLWCGLI